MASDEPGLGSLQEPSWGQKEKGPGEELQCRAKRSIQGTGTGLESGTPTMLMGQGGGRSQVGLGRARKGS